METLTGTATCTHVRLRLRTKEPAEFIDLTDRLRRTLADAHLRSGIINVQTLHTTTAIVVNEHEPRLLVDFVAFLEGVAPANGRYRHDDPNTGVSCMPLEKPNGHAHCRALLLPTSACLNVVEGELLLGRFQRVFFVELDGPREREISVVLSGDTGQ
jgi:secondary thiamine-phosphate synthase enzyme